MTIMLHYPHGYNSGGWQLTEISPSITIANWHCNHFIVEYELHDSGIKRKKPCRPKRPKVTL